MALASQMPPPLTTGLMSHARLPHVARGPCGSLSGVRGNQAQAALKAEQDMKVSTVFQSQRSESVSRSYALKCPGPITTARHPRSYKTLAS